MLILKGLPIPPSTNGLYRNLPGKGRVRTERYTTWANAAGWVINAQPHDKVPGKVVLDIAVERTRTNADISNRIKAVEDLLVHMGIIDDDRHVETVICRWAPIKGCDVMIAEAT